MNQPHNDVKAAETKAALIINDKPILTKIPGYCVPPGNVMH